MSAARKPLAITASTPSNTQKAVILAPGNACFFVRFTEFAWTNHCDELTEKARAISMHRQFRRTFYTSVSPTVEAFNLWRGPYEKDAAAVTVPRLQGGFLGSDGVWRQSQTIENSVEKDYNLLRLEDIKREFSGEDFNMMFMCQWPQQQTNVKGESNV